MGHGGNGWGWGSAGSRTAWAVSGDGLAGRWRAVALVYGWLHGGRTRGSWVLSLRFTCVGLCRFGEAWAALGAENLLTYLNEAAGQLGGRQDRERARGRPGVLN